MINLFGVLLSGGDDIYNDPSETNWNNIFIFIFVVIVIYSLLSSGDNDKTNKA